MPKDHRTRVVEIGGDGSGQWGGVCSCGWRSAPHTNKHTVKIDTNNHLFWLGENAVVQNQPRDVPLGAPFNRRKRK